MKKLRFFRWRVLIPLILLIAIIQFPASIAARFIPAPFALQGVTGTIWEGKAAAFGMGNMVLQQNLRWYFQPFAPFTGKISFLIRSEYRDAQSQLYIHLSPTGLRASNVVLNLPLEPLLTQAQRLKSLRLGGLLKINADTLALHSAMNIDGELENLASALTPASNPFGSYRFHLGTQANGQGDWQLSTSNGALKANGQGNINLHQTSISGNVNITPEGDAATSLKPVLALLPKEGNGYVLKF